MNREQIVLRPLEPEDREQFILDNQEAFRYGALEEFGRRDEHFEEEDEIISRSTVAQSIDGGTAYRILQNGQKVGGMVVRVSGDQGELELLFVSPRYHSRGIGYAAWCAAERLYPQVRVWETVTPYFETRNIHFYVNRCGFQITEFYNRHHPDPNEPDAQEAEEQFPAGMFRFRKVMPGAEAPVRSKPAHTGVRTADSADIPALVRLRLSYLADEHGIPESALDPRIAGQLPRYFAAHLNKDCFAALYEAPDGTPSAAALLVTREMPANPSFPTGKAGTVYSVYTAPALRRQGIASAMIRLLTETAEQQHLDRIRLSATASGRHIYESAGFEAVPPHYTEMEYICKGKG